MACKDLSGRERVLGPRIVTVQQLQNCNNNWIADTGETVSNCRSDVCGTSSLRYNMNDLLSGAPLPYNDERGQVTCGLGLVTPAKTEDWLEVTIGKEGSLDVSLDGPGIQPNPDVIPCEWGFEVYHNSNLDNPKFSIYNCKL